MKLGDNSVASIHFREMAASEELFEPIGKFKGLAVLRLEDSSAMPKGVDQCLRWNLGMQFAEAILQQILIHASVITVLGCTGIFSTASDASIEGQAFQHLSQGVKSKLVERFQKYGEVWVGRLGPIFLVLLDTSGLLQFLSGFPGPWIANQDDPI